MKMKYLAAACALIAAGAAHAACTFQNEDGSVCGEFDSNITAGTGIRTQAPSTSMAGPGGAYYAAGADDLGDLSYKKGDAFTTYLKGVHELLVDMPDQWKFMGRVVWRRDFTATSVTGETSSSTGQAQTDAAQSQLAFKARLLDFWVSKEFDLHGENARVRVGNQVISWGEGIFLPGGINQTNAMDLMALAQPGTQLKEVFLPAPIVSLATGLGHGLNLEAYVQKPGDKNYFPPVGSYWSTAYQVGSGAPQTLDAAGFTTNFSETKATKAEFGAALKYQPEAVPLNLGLYYMQYNDKSPNPDYSHADGSDSNVYLQGRKLVGISANFPVGNLAVGTELSYRPRDAMIMNVSAPGASECFYGGVNGAGGPCYVDGRKYQWALTGIMSYTQSDHKAFLDLLGNADTATLLAEYVAVDYPDLKNSYPNGTPAAGGYNLPATKLSSGYNFDFSWVYDGKLIPGWQVTPEVYYFRALNGYTPNAMAQFMAGAQSANFIVTFAQNPTTWQTAINYGKFWGGGNGMIQPLRDRDFVGIYVTRNF